MNISFFDGPKRTQMRSIPTSATAQKTTTKPATLAGLTKDTFTPGGDTKAVTVAARKYHHAATKIFSEFKTGIPSDHQGVNATLQKVLHPVMELFPHMSKTKEDHHYFLRMIGEDNIKPLVECTSNTVVNNFKDHFKTHFGVELHETVKRVFKG